MAVFGRTARTEMASIWVLVVGIIMILAGGYVWMHPANALLALAFYLGLIFIATGVGYLLALFSGWSGWLFAQGLLDIFVGTIFLINIGVTAISIPIMFAFWALFVGVLRVMAAFQLKRADAPHWAWALVSGILGIVFAFIILTHPIVGALGVTIVIGTYMILYGLLAVIEYVIGR